MIADNYFLIINVGGAVLLVASCIVWCELRLRRFLRGRSGKNLEDVIVSISKELEGLDKSYGELETYLGSVEERLQKSVQNVGVVRFNPFHDAGGDQSFAIALLDENKNGVVFSSLYSREGVRVYAKPIKNSASNYQLSPEEQQAIEKALAEN